MHDQTAACSRRHFLGGLTVAAATGLVAGSAKMSSAGEPAVPASGLLKRKTRLSLAAYSWNARLAKAWDEKSPPQGATIPTFIDYCASLGLDGCELTSYYFPKNVSADYLFACKNQAFKLGLDITGTAIGNDFCLPDGPAFDAQMEMTKQWIDNAALLGAPVIRIFAGKVAKGETEEIAFERCVKGITTAVEYAATKGICLALENHGGITATPEQLLKIFHAVPKSPWFGINFDSGNFRTADPYADLAKIAPFATNAQLKVEMFKTDGKKELADIPRIISILKDADYKGYLILEYEAAENPDEAIPRYVEELRKLMDA
ncbi:MAG: sugar phosphate isomerase/epimerase [Planctomyces sp.]|nr:sugar phosphate isomerase/epimerase [Planctomyces sp.]